MRREEVNKRKGLRGGRADPPMKKKRKKDAKSEN